jgi:hypothetical protein
MSTIPAPGDSTMASRSAGHPRGPASLTVTVKRVAGLVAGFEDVQVAGHDGRHPGSG